MSKPRILIVEDDEQLRTMLRVFLEARGFEVRGAQDGAAAIRALEEPGPAPDVVVSDLQLPGTSGLAIGTYAARRDPATKVLLMSGDPESVRDLPDEGRPSAPVLQKPFALDTLADRIRGLLGPWPRPETMPLDPWAPSADPGGNPLR